MEIGIFDDCEPDNVVLYEIAQGHLSDGSAKSIAYDYGAPGTLLAQLGDGWMVDYIPLIYEIAALRHMFRDHSDDLARVSALSSWCHMVAADERTKAVTSRLGWDIGMRLLSAGGKALS